MSGSKRQAEGETEWETHERINSRCIRLPGQKGLTDAEAAVLIVDEARKHLQDDMGQLGIEWKPPGMENSHSSVCDSLSAEVKLVRCILHEIEYVDKVADKAGRQKAEPVLDTDSAQRRKCIGPQLQNPVHDSGGRKGCSSTPPRSNSRTRSPSETGSVIMPNCSILTPPAGFRTMDMSKTSLSSTTREKSDSGNAGQGPNDVAVDSFFRKSACDGNFWDPNAAQVDFAVGDSATENDPNKAGTGHGTGGAALGQTKGTSLSPNGKDIFEDSLVLDTQTANLLTNVPAKTETPPTKGPTSMEMYSEDENVAQSADSAHGLPPAPTAFRDDVMNTSATAVNCANSYCRQSVFETRCTSSLLQPGKNLTRGVADEGSVDDSGMLLAASNFERMANDDVELPFTEEGLFDAGEDTYLGEIPVEDLEQDEVVVPENPNNVREFTAIARRELKENSQARKRSPTSASVEDDLQLALEMGQTFPCSMIGSLSKGQGKRSCQTPGVDNKKGDTDGNMNQALTFSMMENLLNTSCTALQTPSSSKKRMPKTQHCTPNSEGHLKVKDPSICFSPETDAILNAIFDDDPVKTSLPETKPRNADSAAKGQHTVTVRRSKRQRTAKKSTDVTPPKQQKKNSSFNDSKNDSTNSELVPPTPPDEKLVEANKTGTPQRLVGGVLAPNRCDSSKTPTSTKATSTAANHRVQCSPIGQPPSPIVHQSPPPSMPCTNQSFNIIDVAADKMLFEHFVEEWQSKDSYAICLACERQPAQQLEGGGIGGHFNRGRSPTEF